MDIHRKMIAKAGDVSRWRGAIYELIYHPGFSELVERRIPKTVWRRLKHKTYKLRTNTLAQKQPRSLILRAIHVERLCDG